MKIYCGVPFMGVNEYQNYYKEIYDEIIRLGHTHVDEEFLNINHETWLKNMNKSKKFHSAHYQKKMKSIHTAEICVFEASFHSLGIGFLIQKTIEDGKPCIILHHKDHVPFFLSGVSNDKLILKSYTDKNLKRVLKQALIIAKERRDKRFNFYLSTKLLEYVDSLSRNEGVTKSKVMRDIILRDMRDREKLSL